MTEPIRISVGVQDFITRIRTEGAIAGRAEAERVLAEARAQAEELLGAAQREAEATRAHAKQEAEGLQRTGEAAVQLAYRDAVLRLKEELGHAFAARLRGLVAEELDDRGLIRRLILAVGGQVGRELEDRELERILVTPIPAVPEASAGDEVAELVVGIADGMLREGVTLAAGASEQAPGILLRLAGGDAEIDLTDAAVGRLLLDRILPRFQAMLEGFVS